jgi:hypothetical protein
MPPPRSVSATEANDPVVSIAKILICFFLSSPSYRQAGGKATESRSRIVKNYRKFCDRTKCDELLRYGGKAFLKMIDIDLFKKVSDSFGRLAGDTASQSRKTSAHPRVNKYYLFCIFIHTPCHPHPPVIY